MKLGAIQKGRPEVGEGEVADFGHLGTGGGGGVDALRTVPDFEKNFY